MFFSALDEAKHNVVMDFPGGPKALSPLVNVKYNTLCNKVNPLQESHHLSVDEAVVIQNAAEDFRILQAEATALGHVIVAIGDFSGTSDLELLNLYAEYHADCGETAIAIMAALKDGAVHRREVALVRQELFEDFQRGLAFLARMEALCED